jgi:hypothetical protein
MFNLSNYLKKFKNIELKDALAKEAVLSVFKERANITLTKNDIEVKEGIVKVKASPLVKNVLVIKKASLIAGIQEKSGVKVFDIK